LHQNRLYQTALGLALFTILYNLAEGIIATWLGFEDESLALFGFGVDSFIEVISGLGIVHMITRIRQNPASNRMPSSAMLCESPVPPFTFWLSVWW
jgi:hypothetical protein